MKKQSPFAKFFEHRSLKFQLLSRSLLVMSALLLLIGVFQYIFMQQFLYRNKAETVRNQLATFPPQGWQRVMGSPERDGNPFDTKHGFVGPRVGNGNDSTGEVPRVFIPELSIAIIDEQGTFTQVSTQSGLATPKLSEDDYKNLMKTRMKLEYRIMKDSEGREQLIVFHQIGGNPDRSQEVKGIIQASVSTQPIKDVLFRQLSTFLLLSMLALVFGLLGFLPVLRRTLVPLSNMVDTVKRIDAGSLNERFPANQGQVEIDSLATSFNGMLERLEVSFEAEKEAKEQMRRFAADASHELRTPLTSIHGFLEVLLRGAYNQPEQLLKALKSMHGESVRINKLVEDLLMLARLDRTPSFQKAEGALDEMLREMEPQLRMLAGDRKITIELEPQTLCMYDSDKIKQVVLNLFHNAVQHTHPMTGEITLKLAKLENQVEIAVHDNGPGIAPEHLGRLFDRFFRVDTSRARKSGGAGLGLSITQSIVELHGGTINVDSELGAGSTFRVLLPRS
ncbi:sensor histidine kinase [Paenibacillus aestuarii]|uniref:histidine kinase n=1 Tax=Paenibacillus aestuarii TaxID=516965 RepID=A0ABW0KE13_9BACL|nr:HAMP domain-containing sensor histidine kinase [Paenibacillus aestuarii]